MPTTEEEREEFGEEGQGVGAPNLARRLIDSGARLPCLSPLPLMLFLCFLLSNDVVGHHTAMERVTRSFSRRAINKDLCVLFCQCAGARGCRWRRRW